MNKIKKGDTVIVITGKDKGKQGTVLSVIADGEKLLIEGINNVKKHRKANPNKNDQGGIVTLSKPLHHSNVKLLNQRTGKGERVGIKFLEDGKKVRYFKSTNDLVEV